MELKLMAPTLALIVAGCATSQKSAAPTPSSSPENKAVQTAPAATPEKTEAPEGTHVTCVHESDTRVLDLQAHGNGCNLNYTKYGKTASVAKSTSGTEACEKIEQKIRSKLESAGYSCK